MKKILIILSLLLFFGVLFFFLVWNQNEPEEEITSDTVVQWENALFEQNVREMLRIPSGDIRVSDLEEITALIVYGADRVATSKPTEYNMKKVEDFTFAEKQDFAELKYFRNLKSLVLYRTELISYRFLEEMPSLRCLYMDDCRLPEEAWPDIALTMLDFSSCGTVDLEALTNPEGYEELGVSGGAVQHVEALSRFVNLKTLDLADVGIDDISSISECVKITYLGLSDNQITSLEGLEQLKNLEIFVADGNLIEDISPVLKCKKLTYLGLNNNQITSLEGIEQLEGLEMLDLCKNPIEDVTPLLKMNSLHILTISRAAVPDWSVFDAIPNCSVWDDEEP